jgi:hypothetical protein
MLLRSTCANPSFILISPLQLSAEDYFMEAEVAYFSDDIEGARAAFKRALEIEPEVWH